MKRFLSVTIYLLAYAVFGQAGGLTVHLEMPQTQFISNEDVELTVRVTNRSGQTINMGDDDQWLSFEVESTSGLIADKLRDVPVKGVFTLPSSKTATKRVNITPYFNFRQPGRYQVTAYVRVPGVAKPLASKPALFNVFNGTKLQSFQFGVPPEFSGKSGSPEIRSYVLQQANYLKELKLYFRLADADGAHTIKVFPLAPMMSVSRPEAQIDKFSNLHVLLQVGARSFSYFMINPDGQMLARQTHDYTDTRPTLKFAAEGRIVVSGGVQKISSKDIPPSIISNDTRTSN